MKKIEWMLQLHRHSLLKLSISVKVFLQLTCTSNIIKKESLLRRLDQLVQITQRKKNEEGERKNKHITIHFGIVDKQGNTAADSAVKRDDSATQEMTQNISSPEPISFDKPVLIGSSIKGTDEPMHTSEHKKERIKHQDALLYYVELHH